MGHGDQVVRHRARVGVAAREDLPLVSDGSIEEVEEPGASALMGSGRVTGVGANERDGVAVGLSEDLDVGVAVGSPRCPSELGVVADVPAVE